MKLFLHIGMGKTGTSSIQYALNQNTAELKAQGAHYLGMFLDAFDPTLSGYLGFRAAMDSPDSAKIALARAMAEHIRTLHQTEGIETFIFSNEGIFARDTAFRPFITELGALLDLRLIAYIRNPHDWLPSAFTQWGLVHKRFPGTIQTLPELGHRLLNHYAALPRWVDSFKDRLILRHHHTGMDSVADFAAVTGLTLTPPSKRILKRAEPAEILLRAAFNARQTAEVLPHQFDTVLAAGARVRSMDDVADLSFPYDAVATVIENRRDIFEDIRSRLGAEFDFLTVTPAPQQPPNRDDLQRRLIDYLVEITIQQAERIATLEAQIKPLLSHQK